MKPLITLIYEYQSHIPNADIEILKRMEPLIKKYASHIYCMEYEDAVQELYLTLLMSLSHLNPSLSEGKCINYMKTSIENRYKSLYKYHLSEPEKENLDSCSTILQAPDLIDETYYDVIAYIQSFSRESTKYKILYQYFYLEQSDSTIAKTLNVSRQYVNRLKRKLIEKYFSEYVKNKP